MLESIPSSILVSILRVFDCIVLVPPPLLYIPAIDMLRVSGRMIFFMGFRDSIIFIFLVVLHILTNVPVLLRRGIFQVTPGTNVSRFAITVVDNIISDFLCKTCFGVF